MSATASIALECYCSLRQIVLACAGLNPLQSARLLVSALGSKQIMVGPGLAGNCRLKSGGHPMKKKLCFLSAMLGLLALFATGAWADEVEVTMDFTVTGASLCGSGGTSACVDTLQGSFIWNNATDAVVSGSISVTITGPLDYGNLTVSGPISVGSLNAIETMFQDPGGDYATFGILFSGSNLTPGTYTYATGSILTAGTVRTVDAKCVSPTDMCLTFFPKGGTTFNGTVTITAVAPTTVPEPGTLGLLSTGVMGFAGLFRRRFLC
jgi:PEP-CTERM motif